MFQDQPTIDELQQADQQETKMSMAKLSAILAGLAVVCALFFSLGYSIGKKSAAGAVIPEPTPKVSAATPSLPKPSPSMSNTTEEQPAVASETAQDEPPAGAWAAKPAPEMANNAFVVQVAAVTRREDAEALQSALRKKDYPVFILNNVPGDKLFHVQVGPYSNLKDAEAMKSRLGRDGYNPIVKR
jgi:DedD protein